MKSMSMVSYGSFSLYCVAKWHMGFCSMESPLIHIFAGEKVWHQVMMPMQLSSALTCLTAATISSELLQVVRYLTVTGMRSFT